MGFDLSTTPSKIYFRWNIHSWAHVLDLGIRYNWEPLGTLQPSHWETDDGDWEGGYDSNDGQMITREDAAALANALERALDDIPDHSTSPSQVTHYLSGLRWDEAARQLEINQFITRCRDFYQTTPPSVVTCLTVDETRERYSVPTVLVVLPGQTYEESPLDYFSGKKKQRLQEFIAYLRCGEAILIH